MNASALPLSMPIFHARLLEAMHQGLAIIREMLTEARPFDPKLFRCCLSLVKSKPSLDEAHDAFPAEFLATLATPSARSPHVPSPRTTHPVATPAVSAAPRPVVAPAHTAQPSAQHRPAPSQHSITPPAPSQPAPPAAPFAHCTLTDQLQADPITSVAASLRRLGLPPSAEALLSAAGRSVRK
jgi:hypothetical protein